MKVSIKNWLAKWNDFNSDANRKEFWINHHLKMGHKWMRTVLLILIILGLLGLFSYEYSFFDYISFGLSVLIVVLLYTKEAEAHFR